jgi:hypothetical protein
MVCSPQTMHLFCAEINTISKRTETIFYLTHDTQEFHLVCPKRSMLMVHSEKIVHLSCAEINTVSKWTEMSFDLTHVT